MLMGTAVSNEFIKLSPLSLCELSRYLFTVMCYFTWQLSIHTANINQSVTKAVLMCLSLLFSLLRSSNNTGSGLEMR